VVGITLVERLLQRTATFRMRATFAVARWTRRKFAIAGRTRRTFAITGWTRRTFAVAGRTRRTFAIAGWTRRTFAVAGWTRRTFAVASLSALVQCDHAAHELWLGKLLIAVLVKAFEQGAWGRALGTFTVRLSGGGQDASHQHGQQGSEEANRHGGLQGWTVMRLAGASGGVLAGVYHRNLTV
jgi:hypothetical protein